MYKKIVSGLIALGLAMGALGLPAVENGLTVTNEITASADGQGLSTNTDGHKNESRTDDPDWLVYGKYKYVVLSNGTVEIKRYKGDAKSVQIPSKIDGRAVTSIGEEAFYYTSNLEEVTIPNSVKEIQDSAFRYCRNLKSISISANITYIGPNALGGCSALTDITFDNNNKYYTYDDGVIFNKDKTELVEYICGNTRTTYTIPESVTTIKEYAFSGSSNLVYITIPDTVTTIESYAFYSCIGLEGIVIPKNIKSMGEGVFYYCKSLANLTWPENIKSIPDFTFGCCFALVNVTIPDTVTAIGNSAFLYCPRLKSITLPESLKVIGEFAFADSTGLIDIDIPRSVTTIGKRAFGYYYYYDDMETWYEGHNNSLLIKSYFGSAAHKYALENDFNFELYDHTTHSYTSKVTKAATCVDKGELTQTCSCGKMYTEVIPATGKHTVVVDKAIAPTCKSSGKTKGKSCSVCNEIFEEQTYLDVTDDHSYKSTVVKPTVSSEGYTLNVCTVCGKKSKSNYVDALISMSECKATIPKASYAYTGKAVKPTVTVTNGDEKLTKGKDYTVSYKNNTKTGTATITIKGKGNYSGTLTKTFKIIPKQATLSSVTSTKKSQIKVTWKKDSQATGYQLVYSTSSKFNSSKTVNISKSSTVSKTISKLTAGKKYYVKVRSYKTINGKKVYGSYSKVKTVTVKKK